MWWRRELTADSPMWPKPGAECEHRRGVLGKSQTSGLFLWRKTSKLTFALLFYSKRIVVALKPRLEVLSWVPCWCLLSLIKARSIRVQCYDNTLGPFWTLLLWCLSCSSAPYRWGSGRGPLLRPGGSELSVRDYSQWAGPNMWGCGCSLCQLHSDSHWAQLKTGTLLHPGSAVARPGSAEALRSKTHAGNHKFSTTLVFFRC